MINIEDGFWKKKQKENWIFFLSFRIFSKFSKTAKTEKLDYVNFLARVRPSSPKSMILIFLKIWFWCEAFTNWISKRTQFKNFLKKSEKKQQAKETFLYFVRFQKAKSIRADFGTSKLHSFQIYNVKFWVSFSSQAAKQTKINND